MQVEITLEMFNKTIEAIAKAQARATKEIGKALLMALYFANAKKDAGAANSLIRCLRKSTKQQGIVALLEAYGNLAYMTQGKKVPEFAYFDAGCEWTPESVKDLRVVCDSWEDFKPAKVEDDKYDLIAAVERAMQKAESAKKNAKTVNGEALLTQLAQLLASYNAKEMDSIL
jgi:hypothetical protein